ncbi:hypothetical protein ACFY5F_36260 [Streptomyces sp. NPDC013161]|uniref:hypothetical protein n=1 Tax=Streptomyces sp. NPDC013161 TaxID=3364862 RepID=UPI0036A44510
MPVTGVQPHLKCPKCGSARVMPTVRAWAYCETCRHGSTWDEFKVCRCWGYDCPALLAPPLPGAPPTRPASPGRSATGPSRRDLIMHLAITPLAPAARAALGGYSAFPVRLAPLLMTRLTEIREYASARCHIAVWAETADRVDDALAAVCLAHLAPLGRRRKSRAFASDIVLDAITTYEEAYTVSLLLGAAGLQLPEPGTEFPFSVSDIGRAAADLLGDEWSASSGLWGVRAYLQADEEDGGYTLAVSDSGVLHIATAPEVYRTDIFAVWPSDGLGSIAARVASVIRELRKGD